MGINTVAVVEAPEEITQQVQALAREHESLLPVAPWPASNHDTFCSHGVPSVVMGSVGGADLVHGAQDTSGWIDASKLAQVVDFVVQLVQRL